MFAFRARASTGTCSGATLVATSTAHLFCLLLLAAEQNLGSTEFVEAVFGAGDYDLSGIVGDALLVKSHKWKVRPRPRLQSCAVCCSVY